MSELTVVVRKHLPDFTENLATVHWFLISAQTFCEVDFAISNLISVISAKAYEISLSVGPLGFACLSLLFDELIHKMDQSIVLVVSPLKDKNLLDAIVYKTGRF